MKKIICIGENIRNEDFSLNALGEKISGCWDVELYSTYASSEMQTAFTECEAGHGGHHHHELLIFEIPDENDNPLPAGSYGELVITTLGVEGMPLIRYKTGDICCYYTEPCSCGRNTKRISPVRGRKQQLIKYRGTTIYPQSVFNILNKLDDIIDYVAEVYTGELGTDELRIHVAVKSLNESTYQHIRQALQSVLRVIPEIIFLPAEEIHKLQVTEGKRKPSRFLDKRN